MSNLISILVPFINEQENLPELLNRIDALSKKVQSAKFEAILIDDGSTDQSVEVIGSRSADVSFRVKVVRLSRNFGSHAALRAGMTQASGDQAVFMSADLQDPPELIIDLLNRIREGYDIVFASRRSTASGFFEKIFSKAYAYLMREYVHVNYPKNGFDVVFFSRKVIDNLNRNIEANSSVHLQIMTMGHRQAFVTYDKEARKRGKSKWSIKKKIKLFIDSFVAFSYMPIRYVTLTGIFLFLAGLSYSVFLIYRKILYNDLESGWPMLVSILSIGFGITNISLGIIAEYLWRTLDASRRRPVFLIDEVIDHQSVDTPEAVEYSAN